MFQGLLKGLRGFVEYFRGFLEITRGFIRCHECLMGVLDVLWAFRPLNVVLKDYRERFRLGFRGISGGHKMSQEDLGGFRGVSGVFREAMFWSVNGFHETQGIFRRSDGF